MNDPWMLSLCLDVIIYSAWLRIFLHLISTGMALLVYCLSFIYSYIFHTHTNHTYFNSLQCAISLVLLIYMMGDNSHHITTYIWISNFNQASAHKGLTRRAHGHFSTMDDLLRALWWPRKVSEQPVVHQGDLVSALWALVFGRIFIVVGTSERPDQKDLISFTRVNIFLILIFSFPKIIVTAEPLVISSNGADSKSKVPSNINSNL